MELSAASVGSGLTSGEVAERIAAGRVNRSLNNDWRTWASIVRRNTLTLFNALVAPAALGLFLLGDYRGALAVGGMALTNSIIGLFHEFRTKWHLDRLTLLGEGSARVRRDGRVVTIPLGGVVEGDRVLVGSGDAVVADGTVMLAEYLELDEALLTGESDPVCREVGDLVRSGSVCIGGEGEYVAEKVGAEAFAERTASTARQYRHYPGPTQRTLEQLVGWLTVAAVCLCAGYGALYFVRGFPVTDLLQMVAATITAMVPQGLILLTTLSLVLAAVRLGTRGAMVRRLMAVEGLAAVDVICTDKTGTLTTGKQTLDQVVTFNADEDWVRQLLGIFAALSIDRKNKTIEALHLAIPVGPAAGEVLDQLPFQSRNRCSAALIRMDGQERLLVLGSYEAFKDQFCEVDRELVEGVWREFLSTGKRLIVFAEGVSDGKPLQSRVPGVALRPLALVILKDELRPGIAGVLAALAFQGIRFKVVSGDHPETVRATVQSVGSAFRNDLIVSGDAWENAADRLAIAREHDLFGRVSPEQKMALVGCLQEAGCNVGMIGDGVNDVLPLKRADFGVAMGSGSPAAKAVAGVVLEKDNFGVLPEVLMEGRRVVRSIRRAAKLFLLKNSYTVALILVVVGFCGLPFPYLPQQVTLLNLLTIGGPALLILAGRSSGVEPVRLSFFGEVAWFVLIAGGSASLVGIGVYCAAFYAMYQGVEVARTMLLATLILVGVGNAVVVSRGEFALVVWAFVAILHFCVVMLIPPLAYFFALVPLTVGQWASVVVAAACAILPGALFAKEAANGNQSPRAGDRKLGEPVVCE